ncbi:hypothetical protein [Effusibacillus dendaii]|uniref:Uncharacterized protein n=1 Tax=Effusibacillus dendaii TaxID=2743772 RepID=A0A7I8DDI1_9BACL|nr:hypothetical protein [Effusibacillus dendaii]BCJ88273.1 hypothetical protein skT53_32580 [Effusibacillus dendaii]
MKVQKLLMQDTTLAELRKLCPEAKRLAGNRKEIQFVRSVLIAAIGEKRGWICGLYTQQGIMKDTNHKPNRG